MIRILPPSGGALCISGSTPLGGGMTPFRLSSLSLSEPGGASGTGLDGTGFGSIFSGGVSTGSPGFERGGSACARAWEARKTIPRPQARAFAACFVEWAGCRMIGERVAMGRVPRLAIIGKRQAGW